MLPNYSLVEGEILIKHSETSSPCHVLESGVVLFLENISTRRLQSMEVMFMFTYIHECLKSGISLFWTRKACLSPKSRNISPFRSPKSPETSVRFRCPESVGICACFRSSESVGILRSPERVPISGVRFHVPPWLSLKIPLSMPHAFMYLQHGLCKTMYIERYTD